MKSARTLAHTPVWEISTLITESVIGRHHRLRHCIIICNVANIHLCEGNVSIDYTVDGNQRLDHLLMDRGGTVWCTCAMPSIPVIVARMLWGQGCGRSISQMASLARTELVPDGFRYLIFGYLDLVLIVFV